ncbi:hypothetical protein FHU30_000350 [Actinomadura rupiterrae]|nr:hypothetical protein [Actinomadura rupiterrae]
MVIPLRKRPGHVAIGRVSGPFRYRADEPSFASDRRDLPFPEWTAALAGKATGRPRPAGNAVKKQKPYTMVIVYGIVWVPPAGSQTHGCTPHAHDAGCVAVVTNTYAIP